MFVLNAESVSSIQEAVNYYDCATEKNAYETMGKLDGDIAILTKDELLAIRKYILDMEDAVLNGAFAPVKPNVVNELLG